MIALYKSFNFINFCYHYDRDQFQPIRLVVVNYILSVSVFTYLPPRGPYTGFHEFHCIFQDNKQTETTNRTISEFFFLDTFQIKEKFRITFKADGKRQK